MAELYDICKTKYTGEQLELLQKAIDFAKKVHGNQKRESGEPYFVHPETVAKYLFELGMDCATVIAGVLHDVVEDGKDVTVHQISEMFGSEIADMVDGVTKLTKSGSQTYITKQEQQAENLRKLFLAMANNVRVVIIKLADRLHNMRTLEYCDPAKRARKAKETLEVYAPLAHRFGMGAMKAELEDLSFMHMLPDEYEKLCAEIQPKQDERMQLLSKAMGLIRSKLNEIGIQADINGRPKHLYSIYKKKVKQSRPLEEIYDLIAIRIIVDTESDCYATLGVIHALWRPMPTRFKDYIAVPKPNMYRSLHTTVFSEDGIPFEVQIRTYDMHRTAEYGIAAHWMYKEGRIGQDELDTKMGWLRSVLEQENASDTASEFVDGIMKDFFSEYVFVLSPRGEIIDLPVGSTPLDFAYRIHSNVGNHCQHSKVNGSLVRLDYKLKTNDVVEIITSQNQAGPSRDWLTIVKTSQARQKIKQWFKKANREENVQKGKEMLEGAAKRQGQQLSALTKPEFYEDLLKKMNMSGMDDIYNAIGYGGVSTGQVLHRLMDKQRKQKQEEDLQKRVSSLEEGSVKTERHSSSQGVIVQGEPNMVVRFAHCCGPLPGDDIVGYVTRGRGVSVHRRDCPNVKVLMEDEDRVISVSWAENETAHFGVQAGVIAKDRPGMLMDITQTLAQLGVNLSSVNVKTEKDVARLKLGFNVNNIAQLDIILKNLRKISGVTDVFRVGM